MLFRKTMFLLNFLVIFFLSLSCVGQEKNPKADPTTDLKRVGQIDQFLTELEALIQAKDMVGLGEKFHPDLKNRLPGFSTSKEGLDSSDLELFVDHILIGSDVIEVALYWELGRVEASGLRSVIEKGNATLSIRGEETLLIETIKGDNPFGVVFLGRGEGP